MTRPAIPESTEALREPDGQEAEARPRTPGRPFVDAARVLAAQAPELDAATARRIAGLFVIARPGRRHKAAA